MLHCHALVYRAEPNTAATPDAPLSDRYAAAAPPDPSNQRVTTNRITELYTDELPTLPVPSSPTLPALPALPTAAADV